MYISEEYGAFSHQSFNNNLTNEIISFDQLGSDLNSLCLNQCVCLQVKSMNLLWNGSWK